MNKPTVFGIMPAYTSIEQKEKLLNETGIKLIRQPYFVQQGTGLDWIIQLLKDGYNVVPNFDWSITLNPVPFPTDLTLLGDKAAQFFSLLYEYKNQILFVACENEWNNILYHTGTLQDYLTELKIIVEVGHKYGFKIADAAISGSALQMWTYSQLDSTERKDWALNYRVAYNSYNYKLLLQAVDQYTTGIRSIPVDYINVHWYEQDECYHGFKKAADLYKIACDKKHLVSNEFGIRGEYSDDLFKQTVHEVGNNTSHAILYIGNNAVNISSEQIKDYLK